MEKNPRHIFFMLFESFVIYILVWLPNTKREEVFGPQKHDLKHRTSGGVWKTRDKDRE